MTQFLKTLYSKIYNGLIITDAYLVIKDSSDKQIMILKREITTLEVLYEQICKKYAKEHMEIFAPINIRLFTNKYVRVVTLDQVINEKEIKLIIVPMLCMLH